MAAAAGRGGSSGQPECRSPAATDRQEDIGHVTTAPRPDFDGRWHDMKGISVVWTRECIAVDGIDQCLIFGKPGWITPLNMLFIFILNKTNQAICHL